MKKILLGTVAITLFFTTKLAAQDKTKAEKNIRELFALMDAGATAKFADYVTADFKISNPFLASPMPLQAFEQVLQTQKMGFPDMKHEVIDIAANGKTVVTKGVFKGTNTGSLMGNPPTGNKVVIPFLVWDEVDASGKIKSREVQFDNKSFSDQLMTGMMNAEMIKANIRMAYESLGKKDYDKFKTYCTPDFVELNAGPMPIKGIDAAIENYKMFMSMAPDMKFEVLGITLDGNRAFIELKITGTNTGMVLGMLPPSGKKFMTSSIDVVTFDERGKATTHMSANPNEAFYQIGYGALTNPNTYTVMTIYKHFGEGNVPAIVAACAPDISFDIRDNPVVKTRKIYTSAADLPKFFAEINESSEVTKFEPTRFTADGDDVMTEINVEWKSKANGKKWASVFSHHFKLENGKVVWFREITTTPSEIK